MDYLKHIATLYQFKPPCGLPETEVYAAEQRLGIRFPAVLREYLLALGGSNAVNQSFNRLLPLAEMDFGQDYLVLAEENQGVFLCGIAKADLPQDNPPVHIGFYVGETGGYEWQPHLPDTRALLLELACTNAAMGGLPYCANIMDEESVSTQAMQFIQQNRAEIVELRQENQRFYTDGFHEIILLCFAKNGNAGGVFIGTAEQERFDALLELFGWDNWLYTSYDDEE
ncbi:SMI1/KNR4 family protein [Eikenella sp. S3360]|uniref:SMI1/KNR4 family protein n=1 Tax=Eikenella glucosivorans TaxID=2766967 RepID=A0ABS0NDF6_9NEIS|nr:SMI1/KNR4 family protein [Eikenella glucosivorans]MBH5330304.1 SMI1/KNR4 family protein [Eikenella glucosivorans]